MEEKTFSIPIYDPDKNHIEIDESLSNNSDDLTITFKKPTCPDCGKECSFILIYLRNIIYIVKIVLISIFKKI